MAIKKAKDKENKYVVFDIKKNFVSPFISNKTEIKYSKNHFAIK
jgi:hypothetical protein